MSYRPTSSESRRLEKQINAYYEQLDETYNQAERQRLRAEISRLEKERDSFRDDEASVASDLSLKIPPEGFDDDSDPGSSPNPKIDKLRMNIHQALVRLNSDEEDTTGWREVLREQILEDEDTLRTMIEDEGAITREDSEPWIPAVGGVGSRKAGVPRDPRTGRFVSRGVTGRAHSTNINRHHVSAPVRRSHRARPGRK